MRRAVEKQRQGETPTRRELEALRRWERQREEDQRWEYYRTIPLKHWREMSGRQWKVLQEQAMRYGIPFAGKTIDLPQVVHALHDFLARNARKLAGGDDPDLMLAGGSSPALERYRNERARLVQLDRMEREGSLLRRDLVHERLARLAAVLRGAGEALARQHGPEAHAVLVEALDDYERELNEWLTDGNSDQ